MIVAGSGWFRATSYSCGENHHANDNVCVLVNQVILIKRYGSSEG